MVKTFKAQAYVGNLFNTKTGELLQKKDRKYFLQDFQCVANNASEALTKIGRQIGALDMTHEGIEFHA